MATVKVLTANNVEIEYEVAGVGDRALAALLDWGVMFAYFFITYEIIKSSSLQYDLSFTFQLVFYLPVFLYHLICEMFLEGQSIGKKTIGIRVVMLDAGRPAFVNYFLRWIITPLEFGIGGMGVIPLIVVAASGKGQRLADMAAGTTVIRLKLKAGLQSTLFSPTPNPDYLVTFNEVLSLSDKDLNLIKTVQRQIQKKNYADAQYFAEETKAAICKKTNITSELNAIDFIDVIIKDYQFMATQKHN